MERDPENGMLIGPDGCHYETEWEARAIGTLGMCGCGRPEDAYNFLRDCLIAFDRRGDKGGDNWIDAEDKIAELLASNPTAAAHAIAHLLDSRDVIEHGSGVGGSWLTKLGEEIVDGDPAVIEDD